VGIEYEIIGATVDQLCEMLKTKMGGAFPLEDLPAELIVRIMKCVAPPSCREVTQRHLRLSLIPAAMTSRRMFDCVSVAMKLLRPRYLRHAVEFLAPYLCPTPGSKRRKACDNEFAVRVTLYQEFGRFKGLPPGEAVKIMDGEPLLDPEDCQNGSPTASELVCLAERYPGSTLSGYVIPVESGRDDSRVTIDGVRLADVPLGDLERIETELESATRCKKRIRSTCLFDFWWD